MNYPYFEFTLYADDCILSGNCLRDFFGNALDKDFPNFVMKAIQNPGISFFPDAIRFNDLHIQRERVNI